MTVIIKKISFLATLILILFSCAPDGQENEVSAVKSQEKTQQNAAQTYVDTQKRHIQRATDAVEKSKAAQEETQKAIEGIQ